MPVVRRINTRNKNRIDAHSVYFIINVGYYADMDTDNFPALLNKIKYAECDAVKIELFLRRFDDAAYDKLNELVAFCEKKKIDYLFSCMNHSCIKLIDTYNPRYVEIPLCCLKDPSFIEEISATGKPVIISYGHSDLDELLSCLEKIKFESVLLLYSGSFAGENNLNLSKSDVKWQ